MKPQFTRAVVTILLFIAAYAVSADKFNVSAQSCDFPALTTWDRIFYDSWWPGSSVHVFVDDRFNETDRTQLIHGIQNWSLYSDVDCSGVTFYGFETMNFSGIPTAQMPPDYTVWVVKEPCPDVHKLAVEELPEACSRRALEPKRLGLILGITTSRASLTTLMSPAMK